MLTTYSVKSAASAVIEHLHDAPIAYDYGLPDLTDSLTTGPGHMVMIGAKTGTGKTALALQVALSMARSGLHVAYLSLEMDANTLAERLLARTGTMAALRHRDATPAQEAAIKKAAAELQRLPLCLVEAYGCTVDDIQHFIADHPDVHVVVVDYVQLLGGKEANTYERSVNASKALATLARETGKAILCLAQLNLKGEQAQGEPHLGCIQGSTQWEQDANACCYMWAEKDDDPASRRVIRIVKNRNGVVKKIYLDFNGNLMTFSESADQAPRNKRPSFNFNPAQPSKSKSRGEYDPTLDQRDNAEALREYEQREQAKQLAMTL